MTLSEIASRLGLGWDGEDVPVKRPALLEDAGPGSLCLAVSPSFAAKAEEQGAAAVLTAPGIPSRLPRLLAEQPRLAFARVLALFDDRPSPAPGIHPSAVVNPGATVDSTASVGPHAVIEAGARVGANTQVGPNAYVGHNAQVGADCILGPSVVVQYRCVVGDRVRIKSGAVIGSEGFGYEWDGTQHVRVPHLGTVILEDDVDVGANCCVDRAKTGETRIGRGTKIDNLVQIGHGCHIGPFCAIVSQVGISGSVTLEPGVVLAGQVGVADNVHVGAGAIVSAQSGVTGNLAGGKTYMGMPAREIAEMRRIYAAEARVPEMLSRLRAVERALRALQPEPPSAGSLPPSGEGQEEGPDADS